MAIVNALAEIMVNNLDAAVTWYENLLGRLPDRRPMAGLAEWKLPDGAWIQVYEDKDRAGFSSVTFALKGFEEHPCQKESRRFLLAAQTR